MMSRFSGQLTEISFFSNIFIDLEKEKEREKEKEGWTIKKKKNIKRRYQQYMDDRSASRKQW